MITTIQIDHQTKQKLQSFGRKGDTYQDIINRIYSLALKEQLRELLLSSENTITLAEAQRRHKKKWSTSK